jgi:hypothetical protein
VASCDLRLFPSYFPFMMTRNSRRNKRTRKGSQALTELVHKSTDQVSSFPTRRYTGKAAASNIASDLRLLNSYLKDVEKKHQEVYQTAQACTSTSAIVYWVGAPSVGSSSSNRVGNSIRSIRYDMIFDFAYGTGTTNSIQNQVFNYYLVRWLKTPSTSGSIGFNLSDFIEVDQNSNYTPLSMPNPDTQEDFQVMVAGTVDVLTQWATAPNNVRSIVVPITHECGFTQNFSGTGATSIVDNSVFLVFTALNGINTGGGSTVSFTVRQWYTDL